MSALRTALAGERGGVLVIVAVFMSSAVMLATFVIDVGHWFEHKRHLQGQMDSGAFAGGTDFNGCVSATGAQRSSWASAANTAIENEARKFAGDTKANANALNPQVNNRSNVTVVVNSTKYPGDGGTNHDDPAGPPCQSGFVDLKSTDASLPWFFGSTNVVPKINAHARVSMLQITTLSGSLPLAVEDVNPIAAGALVVNEDATGFKTDANAVLGRQALTKGTATTLNGQSLTPWTGGPLSITISSPNKDTGVVFALCSNTALCGPTKGTAWLNGSVNAVCSQLYVTCQNGDQTGLEFIQGYTTTGTGTAAAPILRSVTLTTGGGGSCSDTSAPYFLLNADCKIGAQADVNFGTTTDPSKPASQGGISAQVSVGSCNLNYVSSTGTTSRWSASACQTIASGSGQVPLTLNWQTGTGSNKKTGSFAQVARPFANDGPADDQSYPIAYARLTSGATCTGANGNSLAYGAATNLCFGIGVLGNLQDAKDVNDPTKLLKFIGGSHTGAIDCGGTNLRDDIVDGCNIAVQINPGEACPNTTVPVDCMPVRTGAKVGQARQGMDDRFAPNGVCSVNHWTGTSGLPQIQDGDPRVVPLIVTLFGAFGGSGSSYVPVTDFATFYVTGWDQQGSACTTNGAPGNEPAPAGAGNGTIWGHFIKYVGNLGSSQGTTGCNFSALAPCVVRLTQ